MLSSVPEKTVRRVQAGLFLGWMVLIASMFWDPLTPDLTHPYNAASPFRIKDAGLMVQGSAVLNVPYAMGARIWWTMLVPLLPLFLMVFGHEAWRRICPLSFVSQLPRRLGFNRRKIALQRRTGQVESVIVLVKRNGWLQRNAWYFQFSLLYLGLCGRLLFTNSDRMILGAFLLGVITAALVVGYMYGGKTWCNYICPVNVVQKIYTEPRGLLESSPHVTRPPISQSTCRTPPGRMADDKKDVSACVGCTSNCGDIDLEKSYWDTITNVQRRHVHYMFWGLILGFYGYYYLYAGDWDYYFSGIWTHEAGAIGKVLGPGLYIANTAIALPKLIAAPLTLALASLITLGLGMQLEKLYRLYRSSGEPSRRIPEAEIVHHCLAVSACLCINTFYLFGGRPNLLLLPQMATRCIDILIVAMTSWWLLQALHRTPFKFRREGLASSLLQQLRRLRVDVSRYLDGRSLEELKPDEIYVLTKVMPAFSHEQKLEAYRNILDDAIASGKTKSAVSLGLLQEMRSQMNISEEEHATLLDELRVDVDTRLPLGAQQPTSHEKWACLKNYTDILGPAILRLVESGRSLAEAVDDEEVASSAAILRTSFQISAAEHASVIGNIVSSGGLLMARLDVNLEALKDLVATRFCMTSYGMTSGRSMALSQLLIKYVDARVDALIRVSLSLLRAAGDTTEARWAAINMMTLCGDSVRSVLDAQRATGAPGAEVLDERLVRILHGDDASSDSRIAAPDGIRVYSYHEVIGAGIDITVNLLRLADEKDPLVQALVIAAFEDFDPATARELKKSLAQTSEECSHPLLAEMLGTGSSHPNGQTARPPRLCVTVLTPGAPPQAYRFAKPTVTVGRATDNDISIAGATLAPYHLTIDRRADRCSVMRVGDAKFFIDGVPCDDDVAELASGGRIAFEASTGEFGPQVCVEWREPAEGVEEPEDTVTRLLWLCACDDLAELDLVTLAGLAAAARVRSYVAGATLYEGEMTIREVFIVRSGQARYEGEGVDGDDGLLPCNRLIGSLRTGGLHQGTVRIVSARASVLAIPVEEQLLDCLRPADAPPIEAASGAGQTLPARQAAAA